MQKESAWNLIWKSLKGLFFLPCWWIQILQRRDPNLWVFGAWRGERYADNSKAIFEYVLTNHPEIQAWWVTKDANVYERLKSQCLPVVMAHSTEGRRIQRRASIAFISWGIDGDMDARYLNGCKIALLWHGMPLKMIGEDEWNFKQKNDVWKRIKTKFRKTVLPYEFIRQKAVRQDNLWTLSTAPFFTPFLQSAWQLASPFVLEIGYPRNDNLFSSKRENLIDELDRHFNHPVKVMYMPTFRDSVGVGFNPFALAGFNPESFSRVLQEKNMVFIYKGHFCDQNNEFSDGGRMITVGDDDYEDLYTFVKDVDVLITDYSSIYFDFLLCHKPIILFPFDLDDYIAHSRPFYFDYKKLECKCVFSWTEMEETLKNNNYSVPSMETVELFNLYQDGRSCERLFNALRNE